ncbi:MAG: aspartyl protease family protein [Acidobacteria bacterium]|nr:aspartyl protease family protein [Acidobacteriota bacterium]
MTGIWTCMAALVLVASPALAQHRMRMAPSQTQVELPAGKDSIRLPLQTSGEHIILSLSVNGSEPLSIVLDTGMPMGGLVLFDIEQVEAMGLEYSPMQAQVGGAGGHGQHMQAKIADGVSMDLGGATFTDVRVLVLPAMQHFSLNHAGIIGAAVFNNFAVTVDYDAGEIILTRPEAFIPPTRSAAVALDLKNNLPYIQAAATTGDGTETPVQLVLDLGAVHAVSLNTSKNDALSVPASAITTQIGRGLSGAVHGNVGRIGSFTLGGNTLKGVVATFPGAEHENPRGIDSLDGNLGMGIMSRFNFTLDYAARTLYLSPNRSFSDPFEWNMSGMILEPGEGEGLSVVEILPGSPAEAAGLQEGDVVLALNGKAVSGADRVRVRNLMQDEGQEVSVRYLRGDAKETARFRLRRLI